MLTQSLTHYIIFAYLLSQPQFPKLQNGADAPYPACLEYLERWFENW